MISTIGCVIDYQVDVGKWKIISRASPVEVLVIHTHSNFAVGLGNWYNVG